MLPSCQLLGVAPYKEHFDHFIEDIQNPGYMGLMKERWEEINKLQTKFFQI